MARIVINDLDPAIYSFWDSAVNRSEDFLDIFDATTVSLDEWDLQKEIYKRADLSRPTELGFATFFLNRTNRSGVLNAGVIGGRKQEAADKINARFNREKLRARLEWLGTMRERITVSNDDGLYCIKKHLDNPNAFVYADPPYFEIATFISMLSTSQITESLLNCSDRDRPHYGCLATTEHPRYWSFMLASRSVH